MQEDAVHTALRAFGLSSGDQAVSVELARGQDTALARVNIMEDSVDEFCGPKGIYRLYGVSTAFC